ncbi:PREDICTED: homeobox protein 5 isoform X1 [Rhagoletis zephyria]|uniref:homeobox protein 5 isoform X1 n=1 Tax=Rhagoletis zephyria TaxID=28612 RepID=UPI00081131AB|nr:PREDICTED: homeobox protein 5 isoform X1 [Rhagoletis zephyria]
MSKKMWNKIFKSSKTTKNSKLSAATVVKANKRYSIYDEYQQLTGPAGQAEAAKKPKKLTKGKEREAKQPQEEEQQWEQRKMLPQHEACAAEADVPSGNRATTTNVAEFSASAATANDGQTSANDYKIVQAEATGANDQLIGNKNNCNSDGTGAPAKQQSTFAKVVSSFSLKRSHNASAQKQEQQQKQQQQQQTTLSQKGNGNVNAAGKLPKSEFFQHDTPTNQQEQQQKQSQQQPCSSHALQRRRWSQQQQQHEEEGGVAGEKEDKAAATNIKEQQQQQERRSSQVLIVIKQIVTMAMPKMVSATTATTIAPSIVAHNSCITAAVTEPPQCVLNGDGVGHDSSTPNVATAAKRMHSSATHDNVSILAAASTAATTTATTITTTTTTTFTTANSTNTRMPPVAVHFEKNNSNTIANSADPYLDAPSELAPCPVCRRTFNPVTLQKHVGICEKMAAKKRNIFDSSRQRREGTELASYPLPKNFGLPAAKQEPRGQSPKPLQHIASPILTRKKSSGGEDLVRSTARASMRKLAASVGTANRQSPSAHSAAATNAGGGASNHTTPNSQMNASTSSTTSLPGAGSFTRDRMRSSDRSLAKRIQPPPAEQCPHCERCFGPKAYDRHVEWCKEKALQASIKHTTKGEQNLAKERLEARTKYRAPCLKTKRSINRDKYAGLAGDEYEIGDSLKTGYGSHNNSNSNNNTNNNTSGSLQNCEGSNDNSSNNNNNSSGNNNANGIMSLSMTSSLTSESGLPSDKYDPFLSAKRQLEELCSSSPPNNPSFSSNLPKTSTQTPSAPAGLPAKMSTSLTLSTFTPNSSPLTTNSQNQRTPTIPSATTNKTPSNFRRTSSLRGPRRSPMLSSRPLFAQNHRPTIQRGLSDEGPISTNFLKPEEYDEMPVRSVCVNDYAVTKSPRVARRDNSLSNRKQSLKLNVQGAATSATPANSNTNTPNCTTMLGVNSSDELMHSAAKYLSKTDSLAAFLKYEKELEKLNAQAMLDAANANASANKPTVEQSASNSPAVNLHNPVITKEFKEKSNTLSKQNSAKSIKAEDIEPPAPTTGDVEQNHSRQHLPTPVANTPSTPEVCRYEKEYPNSQKTQPLRLERITLPQASSTPITKKQATRASVQATPTQLPIVNQPVNLNALLSESTKPPLSISLSAFSNDTKNSSGSEYIDPKLINKCDNLPVNLNSVRTLKSIGDGNAERRLDFSSSSSECSAPQTGPISQLTKLLPLTKSAEVKDLSTQTTAAMTTASQAMDIPTRPSTADEAQPNAHPTLSQRSSAEGRNLLNRKKRLGRNHFLYDASPEADDSCSADDEANRSSVEYYESKYRSSYQQQQQQEPQTCFVNARGQSAPLKTPPIVPPLPIFDDFDFEEFLSSFENDDEQFPLFKDCREFLLNRTSNKQRSTVTPNSMYTQNNNNNNTNHSQNHAAQTTDYNNSNNHFQFPNLASSNKHSHPTLLLTPSSHRSCDESRPKSKEPSPTSDRYEDLSRVTAQNAVYGDSVTNKRHSDSEHKKREIFISIETEPNEHGRSPISPDSLRNMVGNPQTMVEVEVDGCDNKFSKISDDDEQLKGHVEDMMLRCTPFNRGNHLPNVQLNNAKNLIQRMQDDFRQMSEEVGANIRQAMTGLNSVNSAAGNAAMLYGGNNMAMGAGLGGRGGTYVPRNSNASPPSPRPPPTASTTVSATAPMYAVSEDASGDACGDSDDMSSLDGYPISSKSSRRGVGSKLSADSAYGSLSRQRSSELSVTPQRSATRSRPSTSASTATNTTPLPSTMHADETAQRQHKLQQQQYHYQQQQQQQQQQQLPQQTTQLYKYAPLKTRPRRISGSSSSDNSDEVNCNIKYKQQLQQQQQQQQQHAGIGNKNSGSNSNNNYISSHYAQQQQHNNLVGNSNNNHNNYESSHSSPTTMTAAASTAAATPDDLPASTAKGQQYSSSSSLSSTNAAMSASMKMSKFCHECGAKFLVEQAKFCMDCGVRRIVL